MLLSQTTEYAVRAVLHIAAHPAGSPIRANELASAIGVPQNYLSKTLHQLARAGVLTSARGPTGGFQLGVPADSLTLERIVSTFEAVAPRRCLLGHGVCGQTPSCSVHTRWMPVATALQTFFGTTTVADLIRTTVPNEVTTP
jgi:Rrf2 family protein